MYDIYQILIILNAQIHTIEIKGYYIDSHHRLATFLLALM